MPIQDQTSRLRRVLVRPPVREDLTAWSEYGWRARPDWGRAADEHAAFRALLSDSGADVVIGDTPVPGDPDAIYPYDPTLLTEAGAILLRPGKAGRRDEPGALEKDLAAAGLPIAGRLRQSAVAEGGDMYWLDPETLVVGLSYRTDVAGVEQLREQLEPLGARVISFDLPHMGGPGECLHLMSLVSPLDRDLAVVYPPAMPVRLIGLLRDRGIELVEAPEEEFSSMGPNVLALAPRVALALDGNPQTRRRMEAAGVDVRVYEGKEISLKGNGGPTCLTRPLERG